MKRLLSVLAISCLLPGGLLAEIKDRDRERLDAQLDELSDLMDQERLNAIDWTRGTFVATRFFAYGTRGTPHLLSRFTGANRINEALLSGLFVSTHGNDRDRFHMRRDMERSELKQRWLWVTLGTREAMQASIEDGMPMRPLTKCLPATRGPVRLALLCLQSEDILVRRLGLFWGFWMPSEQYWGVVRSIAGTDQDIPTRDFARYLLQQDA